MTRAELEEKLAEHHKWRLADGYPSAAAQKEDVDPDSLTDEEIDSLAEWRANPPSQLKLIGENLDGLDLSSMDFTMVVFENCTMCNCDLRDSVFQNALMKNVFLQDSNLIGASIDSCKMIAIDIGTGCSNLTSSKNLVSKLGSDPNEIYQRALSSEISMLSS